MKQIKIAFLAVLIFVGFNKMNAQDKNNPWSISIGINSVDVKSWSIKDDFGNALKDWAGPNDVNIIPTVSKIGVSRYLNYGLSAELAASVNKIKKGFKWHDDDPETNDAYLGLDLSLLYNLSEALKKEGWFSPYILVGGGYTWFDWEGVGNVNVGAGANFWLNENIALTGQTQYKHEFSEDFHSVFQHSAGVRIKFGGTDTDGDGIYDDKDACPDVAGLEAFEGCPDSDGDGIKDSEDNCPNEAGTEENKGCPDTDGDGIIDKNDNCPEVKGLANLNGCPDTDGDGVIDDKDECKDVAGPVENKGCPWPDTDGDGILDKDDACPDVKGIAAEKGCPAKPKPVITEEAKKQLDNYAKTIYFNSGKTTFKPGVTEKLDMIVEIMQQYPEAKFSIDGHTDSQGSDKLNKSISEKRAKAVLDYLVRKGVASSRLVSAGYGEEYPIADNSTSEGRARNRRVEINLRK